MICVGGLPICICSPHLDLFKSVWRWVMWIGRSLFAPQKQQASSWNLNSLDFTRGKQDCDNSSKVVLLVSFILTAKHVSFEKMSMKYYPCMRDSILLTLWCEKVLLCIKGRVNRVLSFKNVCFSFCAGEAPQADPFFGVLNVYMFLVH